MNRKNLARRDDLDSTQLRQRRSLLVISVAILLYYLAGGSTLDSGSVGGWPIKVQRPEVIVVAAWILWGYFLQRFWATAPDVWECMKGDVHVQTIYSASWRKIAWAALKNSGANMKPKSSGSGVTVGNLLQGDYVPDLIDTPEGPAVSLNTWYSQRRVQAVPNETVRKGVKFRDCKDMDIHREKVPSDHTATLKKARLSGLVGAVLRERTFADFVVPYSIAGIAVLTGAAFEGYRLVASFW